MIGVCSGFVSRSPRSEESQMRSIRTATMFGGASLLLILIAIVVSGSRSHPDQGAAPTVLSLLACGLGIVSAMTFLTIPVPGSRRSMQLAAARVGSEGGGVLPVTLTARALRRTRWITGEFTKAEGGRYARSGSGVRQSGVPVAR